MQDNARTAGAPRKDEISFSAEGMRELIAQLEYVFDVVRLVRPNPMRAVSIAGDGELVEKRIGCCSLMQREPSCLHCIAEIAMNERRKVAKFEFADEEMYCATARYVEVDGEGCVLELVARIPDRMLLDGFGRQDIVEALSRHNKRMYVDTVTGAYNRRYYHERFEHASGQYAVAFIDCDNLKTVNDTFGHAMGDRLLHMIADAIHSCIRPTDVLARYGGDEFVIVFDGIPQSALRPRLEAICSRVAAITAEDCPGLNTSVSIGGAFGEGSVKALVEEADRRCYEAKRQRNCVRLAE